MELIEQDEYKPTDRERAVIREQVGFLKNQSVPSLAVRIKEGKFVTEADHPVPELGDLLLMKALGTRDAYFFKGLMSQLVNASSRGSKPDEANTNYLLSIIKSIGPRDEVESLLAAQMAVTHAAIMTFARRLAHVENLAQQDSAERTFNKLSRTFCTQIEALRRYRTGGEQRVRVEHVTVNSGGQAIVGHVSHGEITPKLTEAPPPSHMCGQEMPFFPEKRGRGKEKSRATP